MGHAMRTLTKSRRATTSRGQAAGPQAQRRHETPTTCSTRHGSTNGDGSEGSSEVTRPTSAFLNGGWGDTKDAASVLGCSEVTVRKEIARGKLTAFRIGLGNKLLRLKLEHVEAYLLSQPVKR